MKSMNTLKIIGLMFGRAFKNIGKEALPILCMFMVIAIAGGVCWGIGWLACLVIPPESVNIVKIADYADFGIFIVFVAVLIFVLVPTMIKEVAADTAWEWQKAKRDLENQPE